MDMKVVILREALLSGALREKNPKELTELFGLSKQQLYYHIRVLAREGVEASKEEIYLHQWAVMGAEDLGVILYRNAYPLGQTGAWAAYKYATKRTYIRDICEVWTFWYKAMSSPSPEWRYNELDRRFKHAIKGLEEARRKAEFGPINWTRTLRYGSSIMHAALFSE